MIKLLVTDCDGCLTDNKIPRRFSIFDGDIHDSLPVVILTSAKDTEEIEKRAESIGMKVYTSDKSQKLQKFFSISREYKVKIEEMGYIGNDVSDVDILQIAGFAMAPKDACKEARKASEIVLKTKGGEGILREVYKIIERRRWICE